MLKKIVRNILCIVGFFIAAGLVACWGSGDLDMILESILPTVIGVTIFTIILSILATIMESIGKFFGKRDYKFQKLSIDDIKKYQEYYREILNVNSPLVVSLVDDYDIELKDIIAELLFLKKNKVIDFENDKISVIENNDFSPNEIDRYIVDSINKYGKLAVNRDVLLNITLEETKDLNLFKRIYDNCNYEKKLNKMMLKAILVSAIIWVLIIWVLSLKFGTFYEVAEVFGKIILIPICFLIFGWIWKYSTLDRAMPYKRTKKGEKLNKQIEGLKIFLNDYSLLSEQDTEALGLWDEYLIYSVLFGQNEKIVEEYQKYIEMSE